MGGIDLAYSPYGHPSAGQGGNAGMLINNEQNCLSLLERTELYVNHLK